MTGVLQDKVVVVTGAGAGIGLGILRAVIQAGARATGLYLSDKSAAVIEAEGARAIQADVRDPARLADAIKGVRAAEGALHGLVNNAGVTLTAPFLEADPEEWDSLWQTNQRSVLAGCQAAARIMAADGQGGALVNVSSVHATASDHGYEAYAGTKGAITAMARAMAWSLGPHGIRVNTLSPGLTLTEKVADVARDPDLAATFSSWHADGQVPTTDEMGALAVFLLSDAASALNGIEIVADKGTTARLCNVGT